MTTSVENLYRCSDMSVAAYLKLKGFDSQDVAWDEGTCCWYYLVSDGLKDAIDKYASGEARIEPQAYNRAFYSVRRQFHTAKP